MFAKKTPVNKLVEECTSVIEENKIYNETLNVTSSSECASCTVYVVLFVVFLTTSMIISSVFVYFHWHKKTNSRIQKIIVFALNLIHVHKQIIRHNSVDI